MSEIMDGLHRVMHEIGTRLITTESKSGFAYMMRWLAINKSEQYDLSALRDHLSAERRLCIPDGWFVGHFRQLLIVAVFEQDDTHSDVEKWRELACAFDASGATFFAEFRRHRDGPLGLRMDVDLCIDSLGFSGDPIVIGRTPWSGDVVEIRRPSKVSSSSAALFAHIAKLEAGCAREDALEGAEV